MSNLRRAKFKIIGKEREDGVIRYLVIGDATFCGEESGLSDKAKFVLTLRRPPIDFLRTFVVPQGAIVGEEFATPFRVCDVSQRDDGRCVTYGLGRLEPMKGALCRHSHYYELVPDFGQIIWRCGKFVAHLDPQTSPDFFTISEAA